MKRILLTLLIAAAASAMGCNKPTDDECRKAVSNIRRLTGTANSSFGADPQAAIRSCKGNASKESVHCMMNAKTVEDLQKCEGEASEKFIKAEEEAEQKRRDEWKKKQEDNGGE